MEQLTWSDHGHAVTSAVFRYVRTGRRQRVVREDGHDGYGPYRWRVRDTELQVAEPCS